MVKKPEPVAFDHTVFLSHAGVGRQILKFAAGETVYAQGDPADAIYLIQRGKVKITVTAESGKEAVLSILGIGDFFGEACLRCAAPRSATKTAITQCVVLRIEKAAMLAELHAYTAFADMFMQHLLRRNSRAEEDLVDQLFNSSEKRLARTLLLLANFGEDGNPEPILAKISQETLAEMIGTTRSRVSFFMNKFRRLGYVDYNGHIEVKSALLKVVLANGVRGDRKTLSSGR
jgi:CRP-like cAMP-binding protein